MKIMTLWSDHWEKRQDQIRFIIIHATGTENLTKTLDLFAHSQPPHRISCHYVIDTDGSVYQLVDDDKTAWHAGRSDWQDYAKNKGLTGLNHSSIGIELQIPALSFDDNGEALSFDKPTEAQLNACIQLCRELMKKYNILPENVLKHSDVAPLRKFDPGCDFPWPLFKKSLIKK